MPRLTRPTLAAFLANGEQQWVCQSYCSARWSVGIAWSGLSWRWPIPGAAGLALRPRGPVPARLCRALQQPAVLGEPMSKYVPNHKMHPYSLPRDVNWSYSVPPLDYEHYESRVNFSDPKFPFGVIVTSRCLTELELEKYGFS